MGCAVQASGCLDWEQLEICANGCTIDTCNPPPCPTEGTSALVSVSSSPAYGVCTPASDILTNNGTPAELWADSTASTSFGAAGLNVQGCVEIDFGAELLTCSPLQVCAEVLPAASPGCGSACGGSCTETCPSTSFKGGLHFFAAGTAHNSTDYTWLGIHWQNNFTTETPCFAMGAPTRYITVCRAVCNTNSYGLQVDQVYLTY
jgi:hypothetical protein